MTSTTTSPGPDRPVFLADATTTTTIKHRGRTHTANLYDNTALPSRPVVLNKASRDSALARSQSYSQSRPRTAPDKSKPPESFSPPIPKIAIFADGFSLKKLRDQYQTLRKSPTTPDLSNHSEQRPQARRANSTTAASPAKNKSPQLPELNFDSNKNRRPPASRSSHGIETAFGPPPSIVTRSSYTSDIARRSPATAAYARQQQKSYNLQSPTGEAFRHTTNPFERARDNISDVSSPPTSPNTTPNTQQSLDAMMDRNSTYSDAQEYLDNGALGYSGGLVPGQSAVSGAGTEGSGQSTEDLFLNLAQDSATPTREFDNIERRLSSRGRNNPQRTSLPTPTSGTKPRRESLGSHDSSFGARSVVQSIEPSYTSLRRASTTSTPINNTMNSRNPSSLPANQRFETYRNRYANSVTPQSSSRRPPSAPDASSMYTRPPVYRPSRLNYSSTRDFDTSSNAESSLDHRPFSLRAADTHTEVAESVVSGAPSTVWDELTELKSRIQRMELQDKMASNGSNGSGERPKTATTTLTSTMSSSPKHPFKTGRSPQDSVIGGPAAVNAYPVLHKTLDRCRELLTPALYRSLETATSDALEMALLTGNGSTSTGSIYGGAGSVVNGGISIERQLRRKADNVVRNLQDLCIALCDAKSDHPGTSSRPGTSSGLRDVPTLLPNRDSLIRAVSRATSNDVDNASDVSRTVPSRALDRIEARRASLMGGTTFGSGANSPAENQTPILQRNSLQLPSSVDSTPSQTISKLPRSGTSLLRMRRREDTEEPEDDLPSRAPSRAVTEIGSLRKRGNRLSGSYRGSREYTSQVPLPGSSPVTATHASNSAIRRLNGTSLRGESPRTPSLSTSLLRQPLRRGEKEETPEPVPVEEESVGKSKALRRSFGLYTSNARASLGLGIGRKGGERRSVVGATAE